MSTHPKLITAREASELAKSAQAKADQMEQERLKKIIPKETEKLRSAASKAIARVLDPKYQGNRAYTSVQIKERSKRYFERKAVEVVRKELEELGYSVYVDPQTEMYLEIRIPQ